MNQTKDGKYINTKHNAENWRMNEISNRKTIRTESKWFLFSEDWLLTSLSLRRHFNLRSLESEMLDLWLTSRLDWKFFLPLRATIVVYIKNVQVIFILSLIPINSFKIMNRPISNQTPSWCIVKSAKCAAYTQDWNYITFRPLVQQTSKVDCKTGSINIEIYC